VVHNSEIFEERYARGDQPEEYRQKKRDIFE